MKTRGYCAFCKSPKIFYARKHLSFWHVVLSLVVALCMNYAMTFTISPSVLYIFSISVVISEMYMQLRWRLFVVCQKCGFDPVLYLKDKDGACLRVKEKLEQRKHDEIKSLFFPLKLPTRKKT